MSVGRVLSFVALREKLKIYERNGTCIFSQSSKGRGKSEDRAMTSWFLVGPRYSPGVSRYLRRRLIRMRQG